MTNVSKDCPKYSNIKVDYPGNRVLIIRHTIDKRYATKELAKCSGKYGEHEWIELQSREHRRGSAVNFNESWKKLLTL